MVDFRGIIKSGIGYLYGSKKKSELDIRITNTLLKVLDNNDSEVIVNLSETSGKGQSNLPDIIINNSSTARPSHMAQHYWGEAIKCLTNGIANALKAKPILGDINITVIEEKYVDRAIASKTIFKGTLNSLLSAFQSSGGEKDPIPFKKLERTARKLPEDKKPELEVA